MDRTIVEIRERFAGMHLVQDQVSLSDYKGNWRSKL